MKTSTLLAVMAFIISSCNAQQIINGTNVVKTETTIGRPIFRSNADNPMKKTWGQIGCKPDYYIPESGQVVYKLNSTIDKHVFLNIIYSKHSLPLRNVKLQVNTEEPTLREFQPTGNWNRFDTLQIPVKLIQGTNSFKFIVKGQPYGAFEIAKIIVEDNEESASVQ